MVLQLRYNPASAFEFLADEESQQGGFRKINTIPRRIKSHLHLFEHRSQVRVELQCGYRQWRVAPHYLGRHGQSVPKEGCSQYIVAIYNNSRCGEIAI